MTALCLLSTLALVPPTVLPRLDALDGNRSSVVSPGDIDHDYRADVIVATRPERGTILAATILALSGRDGHLLWQRTGSEGFGSVLRVIGDLDFDQVADVAVCGGAASVEVISGADGRTLFEVSAPEGVRNLGRDVAGGDATGDDVADLLISADGTALLFDGALRRFVAYLAPNPAGPTGCHVLVDFDPAGLVSLAVRRKEARAKAEAEADAEALRTGRRWGFGRARREPVLGGGVALVPDLDGDDCDELAVGTYGGYGSEGGATQVIFSKDTSRNLILPSTGWCLEVLRDEERGRVWGIATTQESFHTRVYDLDKGSQTWAQSYIGGYMNGEGASLAALPDLNGDGIQELAVGANETGIDCDAGSVAIHDGRTGELLRQSLPTRVGDDLEPLRWDDWCKSGFDVCALPGLGPARIAVQLTKLDEVRVLSADDLSIQWRVKLDAFHRAGAVSRPDEER